MRLSDAPIGTTVVIREVSVSAARIDARLEQMGFLPGTTVKVERRAPLGDPTVYELRGYRLALRRESAATVTVDPAEPADGSGTEPEVTER